MYGNNCCSARSYLTKQEKLEMLEEYRDSLKKETQGVDEAIKELEKGK